MIKAGLHLRNSARVCAKPMPNPGAAPDFLEAAPRALPGVSFGAEGEADSVADLCQNLPVVNKAQISATIARFHGQTTQL